MEASKERPSSLMVRKVAIVVEERVVAVVEPVVLPATPNQLRNELLSWLEA